MALSSETAASIEAFEGVAVLRDRMAALSMAWSCERVEGEKPGREAVLLDCELGSMVEVVLREDSRSKRAVSTPTSLLERGAIVPR